MIRFSQNTLNNLADLLKTKNFLHNTQKDLDFIENLIIFADCTEKKFLGYTMFRVKKEIKQAIKQQLIHKKLQFSHDIFLFPYS